MPRPEFNCDHDEKINRIIRVNLAGEFGAQRIYLGQLRTLKDVQNKREVHSMLQAEAIHYDYFAKALKHMRVRPSILMNLWHKGGYAIGALSGLFGIKYAMLLTEGVEEVIVEHYEKQLKYLQNTDPNSELTSLISKFMDDEEEHKNTATGYEINNIFMAVFLKKVIKFICTGAIKLSERI